jgi:hypothetical protein
MRTVLRKMSTGLYFKGPDQWTSNPADAHNFKMIDHALEFIRRWSLNDVEIAFAFKNDDAVTHVPVDKIQTKFSPS